MTETNRGGRPTVGVRIVGDIRLSPDQAAALAEYAADRGVSRARAIRDLLAHALACPADDLAVLLARWLQFASDAAGLGGITDPALEAETRTALGRDATATPPPAG